MIRLSKGYRFQRVGAYEEVAVSSLQAQDSACVIIHQSAGREKTSTSTARISTEKASLKMAANGYFQPVGSGQEPDALPTAAGLEQIVMRETTSSSIQSRAQTSPKQAKPEIREKKTHVDEIFRLKKELSELREEVDEAYEKLDKMALDLVEAQEKLLEKENDWGGKEDEVKYWRETAERLSTELEKEKELVGV